MTSTQSTSAGILPLSQPRRRFVIVGSLLVGDTLSICITYFLAYQIRFRILPYPAAFDPTYYFLLLSYTIPIWLALFWAYQLYSFKVLFGGTEEYSRVFSAVSTGSVSVVFLDFLVNRGEGISRGWLILFWLLSVLLVETFRFFFRRGVYFLRRHGHLLSPAIIVNADEEGLAL